MKNEMSRPELCIFIENKDLAVWYRKRIQEHNHAVLNDEHPNAGFDLAVPEFVNIRAGWESSKVDFEIKCRMEEDNQCIGYYMYPRSSISKTPLVLSNHVGIIDAGYRGNLMSMFRNLSDKDYAVEKHNRLIQICHPSLKPFLISVVDKEEELGKTTRGAGGFGSTGV